MTSLDSLGKILLVIGLLTAAAGLIAILFGRLGLGRLPGDIVIQRENFTFFFPIATMLVLSALITLLAHLFRRLF